MENKTRNPGILRSALATTSLVLLVSTSSMLPFLAFRKFVPRNVVGAILPDNALVGVLLILTAAVAAVIVGVACCLFGVSGGGTVWLISMKPFFTRSELSIMLGLEIEKQSSAKKLVRRVFDLIV